MKISVFAPTGSVWPKISGTRGQKTRTNDLSCGIRMWAQVSFVLSQSMRLTERQKDGKRPWQYRALHYRQAHGKNTKIKQIQINRTAVVCLNAAPLVQLPASIGNKWLQTTYFRLMPLSCHRAY